MTRQTIIIFTAHLKMGGAERVASVMANYWAEQDKHIILLTQDKAEHDFYSLNKKITRIGMGLLNESTRIKDAIFQNINRVVLFRKLIKQYKPRAIISFLPNSNILAIVSSIGLKIPIIVSERSNPYQDPLGSIWKKLRRLTYKYAASVVIQTEGSLDWAQEFIPANNISIIPNPVWAKFPKTPKNLLIPLPKGTLIFAMGRLSEEKGYDKLIRAFAKISGKHLEAYLIILGEGHLRSELEAIISKEKLQNRVLLPGKLEKPHDIIAKGDIIALSSRYEGFPNALLEGMSLGLAALSFDCPSGPSELIENEKTGLLIPPDNMDAMVSGMDYLLSNPNLTKEMAEQAKKVKQKFAIEKIMNDWENLIDKVSSDCSISEVSQYQEIL